MDFSPPHDMITVIENNIGEKQMIDRVTPTQALAMLGNGSIHHYMLISILRNPKKFGLAQVYRSGSSLMCLFPVDDARRSALIALENVSDLQEFLALPSRAGTKYSILHAPESRSALLASLSPLGPAALEPGYIQYWLPALQPARRRAMRGCGRFRLAICPLCRSFYPSRAGMTFYTLIWPTAFALCPLSAISITIA